MGHETRSDRPARVQRRANLRTALTLLSIAVVFFGGIIFAQYSGGSAAGIGMLGLAIVGFLLVAILRNGRK
jgi:amino acid transporter